MAIGTLTPTLRVCINNNCSTIDVYDTTGAYNAVSNTGGWGATNIDTADVDTVTVTYTPPGGSATDVDVTATVNAETTVTGEFLIAQIDITATDGVYEFVYTAEEASVEVDFQLKTYSTCVVRCCIDKLWAKAAQELLGGDCGCTDFSEINYKNTALQAEALYQAIRNSASCVMDATRDALLAKLQRICNIENCNCN
jgi:hypothetical protein